ncbi:collagen, type I, alpha 1b-like [Pongo abelii]|uniref:collagen, type I, alpha 1b-like n=1 Tax=Pongo abelii TaxID=9601 RepID=UPI0030078468
MTSDAALASGWWLWSLRGPRWRDPGLVRRVSVGAEGRPASQAGRRGTALVSVAVGSRGRVFLVARPCPRFLPPSRRSAGSRVPSPSRSPALGSLCPPSPPAARRSSPLPERLAGSTSVVASSGTEPGTASGGVAAGRWSARCPRPPACAFGTGSAAPPALGPGGLPERSFLRGRPVARAGERGFRGAGRDCGGGVGEPRGSPKVESAAPGAARGPPSRSEAAGGETPRVCPGRGRLRPRGPAASPSPAGRLSRAFPFASASPGVSSSSPGPVFRIGSARPRVRLASRACRGPSPRRPSRASASGRARPPRVALPRSARACARARPGGPSRTGVGT